jgi:hypothetical protein
MVRAAPGQTPRELVIVGGGIVGAMCADLARRAVAWQVVTMVEAAELGSQITKMSLNAGIPIGQNEVAKNLVEKSDWAYLHHDALQRYVTSLPVLYVMPANERNEDCSYVLGGLSDDVEGLWFHAQRCYGKLRITEGYELVRGERPALLIDSRRYLADLRHTRNIKVREHTRVIRVSLQSSGQWLVESDPGPSPVATHVAICVGASQPPPIRGRQMRSYSQSPRIKRVAIGETPVAADLSDCPVVVWMGCDLSLLPSRNEGKVFLNFRSDSWFDTSDPARWHWQSEDQFLASRAAHSLWEEDVPDFTRGLVGDDAYSEHGLPEVRTLAPGIVTVLGASGCGVRTAPAIAEITLRRLLQSTREDVADEECSWC